MNQYVYIHDMNKIQWIATILIPGLKDLRYTIMKNDSKNGLTTLEAQRLRGDEIEHRRCRLY